jgi:hypothetical protein
MTVVVIDGQGGGLGSGIIAQLKNEEIDKIAEIIAVGTNALATSAMLKAGANAGATGENAILYNSLNADFILGPIGLIVTDSMHGEISHSIARAISSSRAKKILVPSAKCSVQIAGTEQLPMASYISKAVQAVKELCEA